MAENNKSKIQKLDFKMRPSWHQIHMRQAELMAERSTCIKLQVGAVLVKDNRTISQGYNGVGPNCLHCSEYWRAKYNGDSYEAFIASKEFRDEHKSWTVHNELHAEQNCILWAAREGISTKDTILYTLYSPCINCAKVIHTAGISVVYYKLLYESDQIGIEYLEKNKIQCVKI